MANLDPLPGLDIPTTRRCLAAVFAFEPKAWNMDLAAPAGVHVGYRSIVRIADCVAAAPDGSEHSASFVTKVAAQGEGRNYEFLGTVPAPVAALYSRAALEAGQELLLLERLDVQPTDELHKSGVHFAGVLQSRRHLEQFIRTVARFNAIAPCEAYRQHLANMAGRWPWRTDWPRWLSWAAHMLEGIWAYARAGEMGPALEAECTPAALQAIEDMLARVAPAVQAMPVAHLHGDCMPQHFGRRVGTEELLAFDLDSVCMGPRFLDVCRWMGIREEAHPTCLPVEELARIYLDELNACGGLRVSVDQMLYEVRLLWPAYTAALLWFSAERAMYGYSDWTTDAETALRSARSGTLQVVRGLISSARLLV